MVVYGIAGKSNNVPPEVFSRMWYGEGNKLKTDLALDLGGKKIANITDSANKGGVVSKEYVDNQLNLKLPKAGGTILGELSVSNDGIVNVGDGVDAGDAVNLSRSGKSHISSHAGRVNVFKCIMKDVDKSESDQNVIVNTISDTRFPSPHHINKKAYIMTFQRRRDNIYFIKSDSICKN